MAQQNLYELLDIAIGTANSGAVNFLALRNLLLAMLGHLGLLALPAQEEGDSLTPLPEEDEPTETPPAVQKEGDRAQGRGQQPQERKEQLPKKDSLHKTTSGPQVASVATNVGSRKDKIKGNKSGISKATALPQDLLEEIAAMKEAQSHMKEEIRTMQEALGLLQGKLQGTASQLPGHHSQKLNYPVVWPESRLGPAAGQKKSLKEKLSLSPITEEKTQAGTQSKAGLAPSYGRRASDASAATPKRQPGSRSTQLTTSGTGPAFPGIKITRPEEQPEDPCTETVSVEVQPGSPAMSYLKVPAMPWESSRSRWASDYGVGTVEALCHSGQFGHLKEQGSCVEATKSDHTEHEDPDLVFPEGDEERVFPCGQEFSLQSLASDLQEMKEKKADKTTLASKVNRREFDTRMERLTETVKEMLSRQMEQEKVQQQLSEEVAAKLDQAELGALQKQLEGHWKNIQKQSQKESPVQGDDAAGTKSPLTHLHCLSCDRSLNMRVPGPQIVTLPSLPPLSPRLTERPRTVPKVEQEQQQGHREPPAEGKFPTVPRSCGGQHTVTTPLQRRQGLHPPRRLQSLLLPNKCNVVDLLAKDSRISGVQLDEPVPTGKEGPAEHQPGPHKAAERKGDSCNHHLSHTPRPPRDRPSPRAAGQGPLRLKRPRLSPRTSLRRLRR